MSPLALVPGILGALVLVVGLYHRSVVRVLLSAFRPALEALETGQQRVRTWGLRAETRWHRCLDQLGLGGDEWKASYVPGAVLATVFFVAFLVCELETVALSFDALGIADAGIDVVPMGVGLLFNASLTLPIVFGVWVAEEMLFHSFLIPRPHYSLVQRRITAGMAGLAVLANLGVVAALGMFRAEALLAVPQGTPDVVASTPSLGGGAAPGAELGGLDLAPGPWERRATYAAAALPGLSLAACTAISASLGPLMLHKLAPALLSRIVGLLTGLAGFALALLRSAVLTAGGLLLEALGLVQRLVITVTRPVIVLFRAIADWGDARASANPTGSGSGRRMWGLDGSAWRTRWERMVRVIALGALVVGSWAHDVEVPEDGVGSRNSIDSGEDQRDSGTGLGSGVAPAEPAGEEVRTTDDGSERSPWRRPAVSGNGAEARVGGEGVESRRWSLDGASEGDTTDGRADRQDLSWDPFQLHDASEPDPEEAHR